MLHERFIAHYPKLVLGSQGSETAQIDVVTPDKAAAAAVPQESPILESDLDTTETETDEDFYDKQPQKLASKLWAEKRNQLIALSGIGTMINGSLLESSRPSTPSLPESEEAAARSKKKSKSKKRKKKNKRQSKHAARIARLHSPMVAPITISLSRKSPLPLMPNRITSPLTNPASTLVVEQKNHYANHSAGM